MTQIIPIFCAKPPGSNSARPARRTLACALFPALLAACPGEPGEATATATTSTTAGSTGTTSGSPPTTASSGASEPTSGDPTTTASPGDSTSEASVTTADVTGEPATTTDASTSTGTSGTTDTTGGTDTTTGTTDTTAGTTDTTTGTTDTTAGTRGGSTGSVSVCGDGVIEGEEACDDAGESATCDVDCTPAACGDGQVNALAGEECDDGDADDADACLTDCEAAECGDGVVQAGVEACDDGNMVDADACSNACEVNQASCLNGAVELTVAPGGTMKVCDHPNDGVCEQDLKAVCPAGWHLCSFKEFNARNAGWDYWVGDGSPIPAVVGEIYCRMNGSAGHFTVYNGLNLGADMIFNCYFGSSRPDTCSGPYGCNQKSSQALCCSQNPKCGNGVVDDPEEECDDGNALENDACLNSCTWRVPSAHGVGGCVN